MITTLLTQQTCRIGGGFIVSSQVNLLRSITHYKGWDTEGWYRITLTEKVYSIDIRGLLATNGTYSMGPTPPTSTIGDLPQPTTSRRNRASPRSSVRASRSPPIGGFTAPTPTSLRTSRRTTRRTPRLIGIGGVGHDGLDLLAFMIARRVGQRESQSALDAIPAWKVQRGKCSPCICAGCVLTRGAHRTDYLLKFY